MSIQTTVFGLLRKATYMCHEGVVDGGLWVSGPARLHCLPIPLPLPLAFRVGCCRLPIMVLQAWDRPLL